MSDTSLDEESQKYVEGEFNKTKEYLHAEIGVLEAVLDYEAGTELERQLSDRIRLVVNRKVLVPAKEQLKGISDEEIGRFVLQRRVYLGKVADELEALSKRWTPADGSFWEYLSDDLRGLSGEFREECRT